jgi:hypothetical protein
MGKLGLAGGRACAMAPRSNVVTWTDDDRRELRELPPVPEPEPEPFTE